MSESRLDRLREIEASLNDTTAWLLSYPTDIKYCAPFRFLVPEEREAFLFISKKGSCLIQASFSPVFTPDELEIKLGCYPHKLAEHVSELMHRFHLKELAIDTGDLRVDEFRALEKNHFKIHDLQKPQLWNFTTVKLDQELELIRRAGQVAAEAWQQVVPQITQGMTEFEVKELIDATMHQLGADESGFPTIVCFGANGAEPHHQPDQTRLEKNMAVLIDFGAKVEGFRSDMTRSFWYGDQPDETFLEIQQLVHDAYQAGIDAIKEKSATAASVDQAARTLISKGGYGAEFIHTTGHGVGLDIHEQPSLNSRNATPLTPGLVITVEPGIYLEGKFGYRHENTVIITKSGLELTTELTHTS